MYEILNILEDENFQITLKEFIDKDKFTLSNPLPDYIEVLQELRKALDSFDDYCRQVNNHLTDSPFSFQKIDRAIAKYSSVNIINFTIFNAFTGYSQGEKNLIHVRLTYKQDLYEYFF